MFGGCPEWPSNCETDADLIRLAGTTIMRFGEFILLVVTLTQGFYAYIYSIINLCLGHEIMLISDVIEHTLPQIFMSN